MLDNEENPQLDATVRVGDSKWSGRVHGGGYEHLLVDLPHDAELAFAPLGTLVVLEFASPLLTRTIREGGELVGVEHRLNHRRCRFFLEHWDDMTTRLPRMREPRKQERESLRVTASDQEPVEVPVRLLTGPRSARRLLGEVRDLGAGGAGLWFPRGAEARLCTARMFLATLEWEGFPGVREWRCQIRNRRLDRVGVRYGVRFLTEGGGQAQGPRFEPLWDCGACGAEGLLAESHRHCPACGGPRGDTPTHLPDWDELATTESHRFTGSDLICGVCGVTHSAVATFCAHCATRL